MQFDDPFSFEEEGFSGFVGVDELQQTNCAAAPDVPGVYLVYRLLYSRHDFLPESVGGHYKGRNPTVSIAGLQRKWVENSVALYIGKAGSLKGAATLRGRLRQYMSFGQGLPVAHWGGRYIWQLTDSASLRVCWKPIPDKVPREVEYQLIQEFRKQNNGRLPFANLRN